MWFFLWKERYFISHVLVQDLQLYRSTKIWPLPNLWVYIMTAAVLNNTPALLWRTDYITVGQSTNASWGAE